MPMNIRNILNQAAADLAKSGSLTSRLDAEVLLAAWLHIERLEFYKSPEKILTEKEISGFAEWIKRREKGEPVAYITGIKEFWSLPFEVNRDVLIPRPETEILVEEATTIAGTDFKSHPHLQILEIGTGSGAISIALAVELPEARLTATDISPAALLVARKNAIAHGVEGRINFLLGNLFEPVSGFFDVIVSNPPYISDEEYECLPRGVKNYEPEQALRAGKDGTSCHKKIIEGSRQYLQTGGWLLMEIGEAQGESIEKMLTESGAFSDIETRRDYGGMERVSKAKKI